MKKLRTKFYQWQANTIIKILEVAPSQEVFEYFFIVGLSINEKAIVKDIWLT